MKSVQLGLRSVKAAMRFCCISFAFVSDRLPAAGVVSPNSFQRKRTGQGANVFLWEGGAGICALTYTCKHVSGITALYTTPSGNRWGVVHCPRRLQSTLKASHSTMRHQLKRLQFTPEIEQIEANLRPPEWSDWAQVQGRTIVGIRSLRVLAIMA